MRSGGIPRRYRTRKKFQPHEKYAFAIFLNPMIPHGRGSLTNFRFTEAVELYRAPSAVRVIAFISCKEYIYRACLRKRPSGHSGTERPRRIRTGTFHPMAVTMLTVTLTSSGPAAARSGVT